MSIKPIGFNRWKVVAGVKVKGKFYKREFIYEGAESKAKAEQARVKDILRAEIARKEKDGAAKLQTFKGLVDLFEAEREYPSHMEVWGKKLRDECGDYPIEDLQGRLMKYFTLLNLEHCTKKGWTKRLLSDATKNRILSICRMICRHAVKHGILAFDPVALVRPWKEVPRDRIYNADELGKIRSAIDGICPWLSPAFEFSIRIPIRSGDIKKLPLKAYNRFKQQISFYSGKTNTLQVAPVPPELDAYFKDIPETAEYLFARDEAHTIPLGDFSHFWSEVLKKAGLEKAGIRWHDTRHHSCTYLKEELQLTDDQTQTIGGWKTKKMVSTYHTKNHSGAATCAREAMDRKFKEVQGKIEQIANVG